MIKSRQQKQVVEKKSTNNKLSNQEPNKKQKRIQAGPLGFKSWHEKTCEVLNRLEKEQGVNIYEEGRFGGMYLHSNKDAKYAHIFSTTDKNIQQNSSHDESLNNDDIAKIFGK